MKKNILVLIVLISMALLSDAQDAQKKFVPTGKIFGKVYWNYHYNMTKNVDKVSSFEITRAYFGYKYAQSENISTKITFDVASNAAGSGYTVCLKHAQLDWKLASPVKLSVGMIGLKQFNDQEHFWGYRYIYKSYQDEYGFGSSADVGVNIEIKITKTLKINLLAVNGGGYKKLQDNYGKHRIGASIIVTPIKGLTLKTYYDMMPNKEINSDINVVDTATISNIALFAAYKLDKIRLGVEYNMLSGGEKYSHAAAEHNLSGFSVYSTYTISKKLEIFARFDQLISNKLSGEHHNWNSTNDGSAIITGIQFSPVKGIKTSLNYQSWNYRDSSINQVSKLYVNFEYKF